MMSREKEQYIFAQFKEHYFEFPDCSIEYSDSPDVILTTRDSKKIGVEITEAIYNGSQMAKSEFQININLLVLDKLENRLPFKFSLTIRLFQTQFITKSNQSSIVEQTVELCASEFFGLQNCESKTLEHFGGDMESLPFEVQQNLCSKGYRNLPLGIKYIRVVRYDSLDKSFHGKNKGGLVPNFGIDILATILDKKHKSLEKYKRCDQQWLVIGEAFDFYSFFDNINIATPIDSLFDKVFIVRNSDRQVIPLKS